MSPSSNRIAEIGIVAVDRDRVDRWTTLIDVPRRPAPAHLVVPEAEAPGVVPSFGHVADEVAKRLSGRLMVAHNARFDHAFLRAEFDRVGVVFNPEVVCSVMLSRRLYPHLAHHDLDSLVECHGLRAQTRHRALPDAELVWQWWQTVHREWPQDVIGDTIRRLLAGPVLPPDLDPSLIDRLPESPGAYVFHGEHDRPLFVGAAGNLKLHVRNYFRLGHATARAIEYSHRITNITCRATRGMLGARLHAAALDAALVGASRRKRNVAAFTWRFSPDAIPSIAIMPMSDRSRPDAAESFGVFPSERVARNALVRLASRHRLCHRLLGIAGDTNARCGACPVDQAAGVCLETLARMKRLVDVLTALKPSRIPAWPHRGPVGLRDRADIHVVDRWQFLGTARSENELYSLLESPPPEFDRRVFLLLQRTLARLPASKLVDLSGYAAERFAISSSGLWRRPCVPRRDRSLSLASDS